MLAAGSEIAFDDLLNYLSTKDPVLTDVCLEGFRLQYGDIPKFSKAIENNPHVTAVTLKFRGLSISLAHLKQFAEAIASCSKLKTLDLDMSQFVYSSENRDIDDHKAEVLASAIEKNKRIKNIRFKFVNCTVGSKGVTAIARATRHHDVVAKLDLDGTGLDDLGVGALATAVQLYGLCLSYLSFENTKVTDQSAMQLMRAISRGGIIHRIMLPKAISRNTRLEFEETLRDNFTTYSYDFDSLELPYLPKDSAKVIALIAIEKAIGFAKAGLNSVKPDGDALETALQSLDEALTAMRSYTTLNAQLAKDELRWYQAECLHVKMPLLFKREDTIQCEGKMLENYLAISPDSPYATGAYYNAFEWLLLNKHDGNFMAALHSCSEKNPASVATFLMRLGDNKHVMFDMALANAANVLASEVNTFSGLSSEQRSQLLQQACLIYLKTKVLRDENTEPTDKAVFFTASTIPREPIFASNVQARLKPLFHKDLIPTEIQATFIGAHTVLKEVADDVYDTQAEVSVASLVKLMQAISEAIAAPAQEAIKR